MFVFSELLFFLLSIYYVLLSYLTCDLPLYSVTERGGRNVVLVEGVRTPFLTSGTMLEELFHFPLMYASPIIDCFTIPQVQEHACT